MNKIFLIISSKYDSHTDFLIHQINEKKEYQHLKDNLIRLNTEDFATNIDIEFNGSQMNLFIKDSKRHLKSDEIGVVWYRRPSKMSVNTSNEGHNRFIREQFTTVLEGLYYITHYTAFWINPLPALSLARNKLQQFIEAQNCNLTVPKMIVTNQSHKALEFAKTHSELCMKSLRHPYFYVEDNLVKEFMTRKITIQDIQENSENFAVCPVYIQEYLDKQYDIRCVILGEKCFSYVIDSQSNELSSVDVRGLAMHLVKHEPHELPSAIYNSVIQFVKNQGLFFSAIDLVLTKDGQYIFIENNPNGQWLWLDFVLQTDTIQDYFINYIQNKLLNTQ